MAVTDIQNQSDRLRRSVFFGRWAATRPHHEIAMALISVLAILAAIFHPPYAFSIDAMIYAEMARAFWESGSLAIDASGGVDGAPALQKKLTHVIDGAVIPQYPSLYGIIAAPFYGLFGVHGLNLLNAIGLILTLSFSLRVARSLFGDRLDTLLLLVGLAGVSFLPMYGVGIWPHMLTLGIVMAAVDRATTHLRFGRPPFWRDLCLCGLLLGLALAIRVDSFLPAAAILLWMALMGAPSQRLAPAAILVGMVPFLLVASALNLEKFGTFMPISYGPKTGADGVSNYMFGFVLLGAGLVFASLIDPTHGRIKSLLQSLSTPRALAYGGLAFMALILIVPLLRTLAWNSYVLVFDLQQLSDHRFIGATVRGPDGFVTFAGALKPALLQSLPILVLAGLALFSGLRGKLMVARGLCFLMAAAAIGFYSLRQWHGGYSLNMRYFLPALPFLIMLALDGWEELRRDMPWAELKSLLLRGAASAIGLFLASQALPVPAGYGVYYLPLVLVFALSACLLWRGVQPKPNVAASGAFSLVGAALALSVSATWLDYTEQHARTDRFAAATDAMAQTLPEGSLVVTDIEEMFLGSAAAGAHVMLLNDDGSYERAHQALEAFAAAGRCVFVHGPFASEPALDVLGGEWTLLRAGGLQRSAAELYVPSVMLPRCQVNGDAS